MREREKESRLNIVMMVRLSERVTCTRWKRGSLGMSRRARSDDEAQWRFLKKRVSLESCTITMDVATSAGRTITG